MLYYLYGIIKDVHIEGIDKVSFNGIAGVIGHVSQDEFGEIPLRKNLESLDWVKEKVLNHEKIIEDVMKRTTIIPMKFCTIFNSPEKILNLLKDRHKYFIDLLERFSNKHEWGLKIYSTSKQALEVKGVATGREYLMTKKLESEKQLEDERLVNESIEGIFKEIRVLAQDVKLNRPTPKELLPDKDKEQVLNVSFLVSDDNVDRLTNLVENLAKQHVEHGIILELVGPLPVYSFIGDANEHNE